MYTHERERTRGGGVLYYCTFNFWTHVSIHYILQPINCLSYTEFRLLFISLRACACQPRIQFWKCCNLSPYSDVFLCKYLSILPYFPHFSLLKWVAKGNVEVLILMLSIGLVKLLWLGMRLKLLVVPMVANL